MYKKYLPNPSTSSYYEHNYNSTRLLSVGRGPYQHMKLRPVEEVSHFSAGLFSAREDREESLITSFQCADYSPSKEMLMPSTDADASHIDASTQAMAKKYLAIYCILYSI